MNRYLPIALLCAAAAGWAAPAMAQNIYRCGDSYSQQPCPGGRLVEASDTRSASQKAQTDQAAQRDAKSADAMEKARLKEEAKPIPVGMPLAKSQASTDGPQKAAGGKPKKPAHFSATAPKKPGDSTPKKKAKKKEA